MSPYNITSIPLFSIRVIALSIYQVMVGHNLFYKLKT